jgi:hypothetical protein
MQNEGEPVAKRKEGSFVEYVCPVCGGWDGLCAVFPAFLLFVDHLIGHLCLKELRELSQPFPGASGEALFRNPDTYEVMHSPPEYRPDSLVWRQFLTKGQKLLPQAKVLLPGIADWLEKALASIEQLKSIKQSGLLAAERLVELVKELPAAFQEQREYLLGHEEKLKDTGMDPKWKSKPDEQARFVARSLAGARWGLKPSTSREFIRQATRSPRGSLLESLGLKKEGRWWEP